MEKALGPTDRKAFRDNYLAAGLILMAFFLSNSVNAQIDTTRKRSDVNGDGFNWKSGTFRNMLGMPLDTFKLRVADSGAIAYDKGRFYAWTGYLWATGAQVGPELSRPAPGIPGRQYSSSDSGRIWLDLGASWLLMSGGGAGSITFVYTNRASLRAMGTPSTSVGYYLTDAGSTGFLRYNPADGTTPDDTAFTIVTSNGKRLARDFTGPPQLGWWGVATDSSLIIQALANPNVRQLQIPNGTFSVRNISLVNLKNKEIFGSGNTILQLPVTGLINAALITISGCTNVRIHHLELDMHNAAGSQAGGTIAVRADHDTAITIEYNNIHDNPYTAISLQQYCYNFHINHNLIVNTDVCIHLIGSGTGSTYGDVGDNTCIGGTSEGITFQGISGTPGTQSQYINVHGNKVIGKVNSSGYYMLYSAYIDLGGNWAIGCKSGISGSPNNIRPGYSHHIHAHDNHIINSINDGIGNLGPYSDYLNNTFDSIGRQPITVADYQDTSKVDSFVTVRGNKLLYCNVNKSANWVGISVGNTYSAYIDHNQVYLGPGQDTVTGTAAIKLKGQHNTLTFVEDNTCPDGQITSNSFPDNDISFNNNAVKNINLSLTGVDSLAKKWKFRNNTYTSGSINGQVSNSSGFATGINAFNPRLSYNLPNNAHIRTLEGTFANRQIQLVSSNAGNTILPGVGNIKLKYGLAATLDSGMYLTLFTSDGQNYNEIDRSGPYGHMSINYPSPIPNHGGAPMGLMIVNGHTALDIGANNGSDILAPNTSKLGIIVNPVYEDTTSTMAMIRGTSDANYNIVDIGIGNSGNDQSAQKVRIGGGVKGSLSNGIVGMAYAYGPNRIYFGGDTTTNSVGDISGRLNPGDPTGNIYTLHTYNNFMQPVGSSQVGATIWMTDSMTNQGNAYSNSIWVFPKFRPGLPVGTLYKALHLQTDSGGTIWSDGKAPSYHRGRFNLADSTGNASAQLYGGGTNQGWRPPVMTGAQMNAIVTPTPGLFVVCSDSAYAICYYDNSAWRKSGYGLTGGGGGSDSGFAVLSSSLVNVPIQKSVIGAKRYVLWDTAANNPGAITTKASRQGLSDSLQALIAKKQDTSSKFNLYFRGKGQPGDTSSVYGHDSSIYVRAKRDSLDYHHTVLPDSSEVDFVQAHDTTSGNGLQSIYRSDTARANIYAAIATRHIYSKNAAIAVSGDSVQAQNLAFVDSTSNGVLGVLYDSLTWNSPLGYLQQSGSGVTVSSNQIQLVEADNNGTVYVRLPTNTCLDQQNLSANFVIKATNSGDSGAMISLVSVNTHSISSLFARLNTTTRKVELLTNQNGSTTIITSAATLPTSIATGDSITLQLINNNQVITAQATDRTTANTISVSFSNTFAFGAPLFIANTGQVTFNSGNGTYQLNRLTYSSNLPKNQRLGVVGYSITQGYAAGSIAGTWSRAIGGVVSAGSADYTASILLPGRLQEMHALGERNWIIGGLAGNDIQFGVSSGVWQANLINIYDSIISWGSNCYFTLETPRNGVDITAANTFIKATFPNLYIDLFTPLWSGTSYTMNPIYNTGDGTHPNAAGHSAMTKGTEQSFVYNLIQNGAQIPVVTPVTPGAATTVQVSTGAGLAGYPEFFYNHALTQLYSPLIAGGTLTGTGLMIHSNSGFGNGTISFGSTSTGMNYQENNASLAIGTGSVTSGTKLDVRGGGLRVGTTNAAMIFPDYAGSGPATAGSVLIACGACGSGQGLVLDANSNAGTSGAFVKAVAYNGTTLRTVWEYSNTTAGAVPTLKIMDSSGFVRFGATSADTLSSAARGSYTTNLGSTFTPYSWIDYNSADSLAKKRAHDSALAYATVSPKKFAMTADASVNNTSTPTSLIGTGVGSMTIPANSLIAGSTITFKGSGTITTAATPPTMSFSMSVGTSFSATAPTIGASLNGNYEFQYDCIVRTTGAGGTCEFTGWVSVAGTKSYIATGVFALDTTTGNLVDLVLTMGGTVGSGDVVTTKTSSLFVQ